MCSVGVIQGLGLTFGAQHHHVGFRGVGDCDFTFFNPGDSAG